MPRKRVLLVEDEKEISRMIAECLEDEGFEVVLAGDGFEALALVDKQDFDLIITDLGLPKMDGNRLVELLPERAEGVPVVMITANPNIARSNPRIRLLIPKPFDLNRLVEEVCKLAPVVMEEADSWENNQGIQD